MKHYCNRRIPKSTQNTDRPVSETTTKIEDDIILPPVDDTYPEYDDAGCVKCGYGGAYNRIPPSANPAPTITPSASAIYYDNMQGKFDILSVPAENRGLSSRSVSSFLDRYIGKLICLDLWTSECSKEELCGILLETGRNYIVINIHNTEKVMMVDLRSIRYVSIYCR